MKKDLQRMVKNKEMFEKTKKELEQLKQEKKIRQEESLKNERS